MYLSLLLLVLKVSRGYKYKALLISSFFFLDRQGGNWKSCGGKEHTMLCNVTYCRLSSKDFGYDYEHDHYKHGKIDSIQNQKP